MADGRLPLACPPPAAFALPCLIGYPVKKFPLFFFRTGGLGMKTSPVSIEMFEQLRAVPRCHLVAAVRSHQRPEPRRFTSKSSWSFKLFSHNPLPRSISFQSGLLPLRFPLCVSTFPLFLTIAPYDPRRPLLRPSRLSFFFLSFLAGVHFFYLCRSVFDLGVSVRYYLFPLDAPVIARFWLTPPRLSIFCSFSCAPFKLFSFRLIFF